MEGIAELTSQTEKIKEQGEQIEQKIEQLLEVSNEQGEQIKQMNTGFTLSSKNQEKATNQLSGQLTDHGQQISEQAVEIKEPITKAEQQEEQINVQSVCLSELAKVIGDHGHQIKQLNDQIAAFMSINHKEDAEMERIKQRAREVKTKKKQEERIQNELWKLRRIIEPIKRFSDLKLI